MTRSDKKTCLQGIVTRLDSDQPVQLILGTSESAIYDDEQVGQVNLSSRIVTKSDKKNLSLRVVTRLEIWTN